MYPITPLFEDFLKRREQNFHVKVNINGIDYGRDTIIDFEIDNSIVSGEDFEIGTAITSKLTLRLKSYDKLPDNAKIVPYLALSLDSMTWEQAETAWQDADWPWSGGTTEWMPLGEFYVDGRQQINASWEYVCFGKLMFANVPYISQLSYPATMQAVWDEICNSLEYEYDSSVVIDPSYTFPIAPTGLTKRQVMAYIACVHVASVYEGKDGKIKFKAYTASEEPVYEMDTSDYIRMKQVNPIKTYTRIVATYDTEQDLKYEAGEGDDNHTLFIESPLLTQELVNDMHAKLNGFTFMPVSMDARGYPQLDIGDLLGVYRDDSLPWVDTHVAWENMELPWNGMVMYKTIALKIKYTFKGGLSMTIDSNAQSEQRSEFKVDGSITGQIKELNKSAAKLDRNYYGVTLSRDYGLRVDRSDNLAYSIWNADEFRFVANGEDALWFDVPSRKFHFSGTLVGVDGEFSGTVSAAIIIGSQVQGGTIEGTVIVGSEIYGAYIATSESYPRVEMSTSANMFGAYQTASNYVRLTPLTALSNDAAPGIEMKQGSSELTFGYGAGSLGSFGIYSSGIFEVQAMDGVYVNDLYVATWSHIKAYSNGNQTLQSALNAKADASALDSKADKSSVNSSISALLSRIQALEAAVGI